jgi:nucleoside-diphosphate-sugar epimerase
VLTNHRWATRRLPGSVLVTGASGFVGQHVSSALLAEGVAVRGLVRRPDARLPAGAIPQLASDLDDVPALRQALAGVDGVIHLAARVHLPKSPGDTDAFREVNVEGTRSLLAAAVAAGVRDFVFVSTVKVMGETSDEPWTEDMPAVPVDPYGATKLEAEQVVREFSNRAGLHAPILRPPLVYGPGMRANALRLFHAIDRGLPLPLGGIQNRRSFLYVGNLTAALLATLTSDDGNDTFFVSDAQDLSTSELATAVARALGRPSRLVRVPVSLLKAAGRIGDLLARVRPFPLNSAAVARLVGSLAVDSSKLSRQTGYSPPFAMTEGLRVTAEWYRSVATSGT